jgi:class 3 adenylate cyclase
VSSVVPTTTGPSPTDAERRQVTVMFADLVGSTALSARMDPEDLREVIAAYQKCVAETVRRFDGFVAKYLGDGVLVYFGYPQAHEDDAERAVRAGLELIAATTGLKTRASLQTRVGIATGLVVVGDLIGSGDVRERGIVGETPNLAARLQGIAEPNMVVIAESTRRLLGNLFELQELGARDLKGIPGPVRAWAALRPSSVESRFEALHATGLTALVGREEEFELLLRRWSRAKKTGEGQVVLLSGEPGLGKSRLVAAFAEQIASEPHTRLQYFFSPYDQTSALYPVISQLGHAARFERDDDAATRLDKLEALLGQTATTPEDVALIADLLSIPVSDRYPPLNLTPQQRKDKTFAALLRQLVALARERPVMMVFEDAHWSDPSSLELLDLTIDRIQTLPVLLFVIFRPEIQPPWTGQAQVTTLTLNRLNRRNGAVLVKRIVGNQTFPDDVIDDIVERTDGVPLFVEELTKATIESGVPSQEIASPVSAAKLAVPATLHSSLMARLDRLGTTAKQTAQVGAAIGREFTYELLVGAAEQSGKDLQLALDQLVAAGLIFQRGAPPHGSYLFKHALT